MAAPVFVNHFISIVNGPGLVMLSAAANKSHHALTGLVVVQSSSAIQPSASKASGEGAMWTYQTGAKRLEV